MKIRMLIQITGTRDGERWPEIGGVVDVPKGEADGYIAQGYAEAVKSVPRKATKTPKGEKR